MDDDEDDQCYSDSTILKPIVKQEDNEKITSTMNSSSIDTTFSEETQNLTPNRRRVRVRFAYSFDNDRFLPITQTTIIKTEPYFKVTTTEDQVTKHFYQNKPQIISKEHEITQFIKQRIPSEADSLEDEYSPKLIKERETPHKIIVAKHPVHSQTTSSLPIKSILKKPQKIKKEISISKIDRSLISRSPSPSSSKKKQTFSTRLNFNQVQHLAEITAKHNSSPSSIYHRSLFDQTINIFDPNNSYQITSNAPRPSRLQYYIKPYRGESNIPTNMNKQRSRSLSQNRLAQQSVTTRRCYTFSNQYARPLRRQSNRKQHVPWSPETPSGKTNSSLLSTHPSLSLSNPCLQSFPSMISVPVRYQTSQSSRFPSPPLSTDSYYTPSVIDRPLTSLTSRSQYSYEKEEKENMLRSHLPDIIYQHKKEHGETMQRYDRLIEKLHVTGKQLQSLSRSRTNNAQQRTRVKMDRGSNISLNKMTNKSHFFSPMILQICLIILVIFNLLVAYFFNEIKVWWSGYTAPTVIMEQHDEDTLNF